MTAADRNVPTLRLAQTVDEMVEALVKQPPSENDIEWFYEVEGDGLTFWQNGVLVERWVQK